MEEAKQLNIYQRIREVMREVDYIQKGDKKVNNQYRFVSHDQVTAAIHPQLVKHGIAVIPTVDEMKQEGNRTEVTLAVEFINVDDPKDRFEVMFTAYGIDQGDKGPGKCISYAYKYALLKTFCLETGDDPDNEAESKFEPYKEETKPSSMSVEEYKELTYYLDKLPEYKKEIEKFLEKVSIKNLWEMSTEMKNKVIVNCKKKLGIEEESNATGN